MSDGKSSEIVSQLEEKLGLKTGFFDRLLAEDDWSFVVKLHALMEAAVSHLVCETLTISMKDYSAQFFDKPLLAKLLAYAELSNKRTGKTTLARSLGLILDYQRDFLYHLSELRNDLVHDVRNVSFQLTDYVAKLDVNQRKNFVEAFGPGAASEESLTKLLGKATSREEFTTKNPKVSIWLTSLVCLEEIHYCIAAFVNRQETHRLEKELLALQQSFLPVIQAALQKVQ